MPAPLWKTYAYRRQTGWRNCEAIGQVFTSLRVNDQYRVVFRFVTGTAIDVRVTDYH
jgi:plasmid maintenance system killer protein